MLSRNFWSLRKIGEGVFILKESGRGTEVFFSFGSALEGMNHKQVSEQSKLR